ncbi:MAG: DUF5615 family PIN-like protein [Acidimicrobiales bacterium]
MSSPLGPALLLDEMFSPAIAQQLRDKGYDVLAVAADPALRALDDAELYEWARSHGRRVVTENVKDFRRLLWREEGGAGPGVLLTSSRSFPRSRRSVGVLVVALENWLRQPDSFSRPPEDWLVQLAG